MNRTEVLDLPPDWSLSSVCWVCQVFHQLLAWYLYLPPSSLQRPVHGPIRSNCSHHHMSHQAMVMVPYPIQWNGYDKIVDCDQAILTSYQCDVSGPTDRWPASMVEYMDSSSMELPSFPSLLKYLEWVMLPSQSEHSAVQLHDQVMQNLGVLSYQSYWQTLSLLFMSESCISQTYKHWYSMAHEVWSS